MAYSEIILAKVLRSNIVTMKSSSSGETLGAGPRDLVQALYGIDDGPGACLGAGLALGVAFSPLASIL